MKIRTLHAIRRTAIASLLALGMAGSHLTPAAAAITGERIIVSDNWLNMALDVSGASTAKFAKVIQWWPTGSTNQPIRKPGSTVVERTQPVQARHERR